MTEYDDIKKALFTEDRELEASDVLGTLPSNAEIIHTEFTGGPGPLHVWYRVPQE